jgi:hypothetical protein
MYHHPARSWPSARHACCRNIETTALLLEACGCHKSEGALNGAMVANAGAMIFSESVRLRGVIASFHPSQGAFKKQKAGRP